MTDAHEATESNPESVLFARHAAELAVTGEYDQAITVLNEGLTHHGTYAAGYQVLGDIHARRGDIGQAIEAYDRALQLDPQNPRALFLLGKLYLDSDTARAQDLLWRARRYEPDVPELEQVFADAIAGPGDEDNAAVDNDLAALVGEEPDSGEQDIVIGDTVIEDAAADTVIIDTGEPPEETAAAETFHEPETAYAADEELDLSIVTEQALNEFQAEKRSGDGSGRPLDDRDALEELVGTSIDTDTTGPEEIDEVDSELKHILADFDEDSEDLSYLVGGGVNGETAETATVAEPESEEHPSSDDLLTESPADSDELPEDILETMVETLESELSSDDAGPGTDDTDLASFTESIIGTAEIVEALDSMESPGEPAPGGISDEDISDIEPEISGIGMTAELEAPDEEPLSDPLALSVESPEVNEDILTGVDALLDIEPSDVSDPSDTQPSGTDLSYLYGGDMTGTAEEDSDTATSGDIEIPADTGEDTADSDSYTSILAEMADSIVSGQVEEEAIDTEATGEYMTATDPESPDEEPLPGSTDDTGELPTVDNTTYSKAIDIISEDEPSDSPETAALDTDLSYLFGGDKQSEIEDAAIGETVSEPSDIGEEVPQEVTGTFSYEAMAESMEPLSEAETADYPIITESEEDSSAAIPDEEPPVPDTTDSVFNATEITPAQITETADESDMDMIDRDMSSPAIVSGPAPATDETGDTVYEVTDGDHDSGGITEEEAIAAYSKLLRDIDLSGIETDERDRGVLEIGEEELSSLTFDENSTDTIDEPVLSEEERAELSALESITDEYEAIRSAGVVPGDQEETPAGVEGYGDMDYDAILGITGNAEFGERPSAGYDDRYEPGIETDDRASDIETPGNIVQERGTEEPSADIVETEEIEPIDLGDVLSAEPDELPSEEELSGDTGRIVEEMMRGSMNIRLTPASEDMDDVDRSSLDSLISEYVSTLESLSKSTAPETEPFVSAEKTEATRPVKPRQPAMPSVSKEMAFDIDRNDDDTQGESTATMAEIYVRQGLITRAIDIYTRIVEKQPGNEAARTRLDQLVQMRDNDSREA